MNVKPGKLVSETLKRRACKGRSTAERAHLKQYLKRANVSAPSRQDRLLCIYGQLKSVGEEKRRPREMDELERRGRERERGDDRGKWGIKKERELGSGGIGQ